MSNYDSDDYTRRGTPPLRAIQVKAKPSPTPPPFYPRQAPIVSSSPEVSPVSPQSSSKRRKRTSNRRRKAKASQGDAVLVGFMDPNRPDIAYQAGQRPIISESQSEVEDVAEDDDGGPPEVKVANVPLRTPNEAARMAQVATQALQTIEPKEETASDVPVVNGATTDNSDRMDEDSKPPAVEPSPRDSGFGPLLTESRLGPPLETQIKCEQSEGPRSPYDQRSPQNQNYLTASTTLPHRGGSPSLTLRPIQDPNSPKSDGPSSPNQTNLPGIGAVLEAVKVQEVDTNLPNGLRQRAQSLSTGAAPAGPSPTLIGPYPGQQRSPQSITHSSPISINTHNEISPRDGGYVLSASPPSASGFSNVRSFAFPRRTSQASENGRPPYPPPLHSASTTESYSSAEGFSPNSNHHTPSDRTPGRDIGRYIVPAEQDERSILPRTAPGESLPQPPRGPTITHVPPHGAGGFKCDFPGCTAQPFQTQYLLNSHANVHSQQRPHFCPVPSCPRGEGGKGFKRKNEMIRHGLVHDSPGYVCPFCPDREHRYPRPDNLQRHVRVHHSAIEKDDPMLREVLAQRPEGGSRGRRRRLNIAPVP